jgi:hypothetical protein
MFQIALRRRKTVWNTIVQVRDIDVKQPKSADSYRGVTHVFVHFPRVICTVDATSAKTGRPSVANFDHRALRMHSIWNTKLHPGVQYVKTPCANLVAKTET